MSRFIEQHSPDLTLRKKQKHKSYTNIPGVNARQNLRNGMCCIFADGLCNLWSVSSKPPLDVITRSFRFPPFPKLPQLNSITNICCWLKTVLCCITWHSEHSRLCHCCTVSCVQWHGGWASRCRIFHHVGGKYLKGNLEPTNMNILVLGKDNSEWTATAVL